MKLFVLMLLLTISAQATLRQDIAAPQARQGPDNPVQTPPAKITSPRWLQLSDGRRVDLRHWKLVLFMQSSCGWCQRFDPLLRRIAENLGLSVFAYSLDGQGDSAFPHALPVPPAVLAEFFPPNLQLITPTTFLINVNTLTTLLLSQGAMDESVLRARLDAVFQLAMNQAVRHEYP